VTSLTYDTIASLTEPAPTATHRGLFRVRLPLRRRGILKGTVAGAIGATMVLFERAPLVREAQAACTGTLETTIRGGCPSEISGTCSPACGPSPVYSDVCDGSGWHKTSGSYRMRPNQCPGSPYDGWSWFASPCGCPSGFGRNYRCHDGCKLVGGSWVNSICRTSGACFG
jgi:hypothetical protein